VENKHSSNHNRFK